MKNNITTALALVGIIANAQEKDSISLKNIEEVVIQGKYYKNYTAKDVSGSLRLDTPLLNTPQNIQVITSSAIADQQTTSISDGVLRNVSGATRLEHWADLYARINMRGSRASAFINGVNVTSNWGPLAEDMSYVDRIEFMKGPAGFMMSNGEPSGIYNIVTKKPFFSTRKIKGQAGFTLGSYNLYRGEADINATLSDKIAIRLNLMGQNKKSFRDYEFNNRYIINPSVIFKISNKSQLIAEYIYQKAKMSEVGSVYVFSTKGYAIYDRNKTLTDPNLPKTNIDEHYANLNFQTQFSDNWKLTAQGSFVENTQMGGDIWPQSVNLNETIIRRFHFWESKNTMFFGQAFLNGNIKTGNVSHKILTGIDLGDKKYLADWSQSYPLDTMTNPFYMNKEGLQIPILGYPTFTATTSLKNRAIDNNSRLLESYIGLYFQDEIGFLENNLRLTVAGRYTSVKQTQYANSMEAKHFTPRIGISGTLLKTITLYGLYDQTFLPQQGLRTDGRKTDPITGDNIEAGIKKDWFNGRLNSTVSIYRINKNNELTIDPNSTSTPKTYLVKGQSRTEGVEFDIKGEISKGLNIILNYAFTESKISKTYDASILPKGSKIAGHAKHNFNTWINYTIPEGKLKGLGAQVGFTFLGDRSSWAWNNSETRKKIDDYRKWDAGIFWGNDKLKLTLNIFNLLDEYLYSGTDYGSYYYYQAESPRNLRLSLSYKF